MSILRYIKDPSNSFSAVDQATLSRWRLDLDIDDAWKLIGRNFDRDCDRVDIDHVLLRDFLRDIASGYSPSVADAPLSIIDSVIAVRRRHFLLPGLKLNAGTTSVAHVVRADHLIKYHLRAAGVPITMDLGSFIAALRTGAISGKDLAGSQMSRADYPVWVCPAAKLAKTADDCRDKLGLHHIHHGHLVSMTYPVTLLECERSALRAPTSLDGVANGANNWIFAKRKPTGGPEWGHAVDLGSCAIGTDEAVHGDFSVDTTKAAQIVLYYVGQVKTSSPQISFANLLARV